MRTRGRAPFARRFLRVNGQSVRIGNEGPCVLFKRKHKVSQSYSPADDSAGSLTPFEMTLANGLNKTKNSKLHHYPNFIHHSVLSAFIGEMDAARRAGITAAKNAEIASANAAMPRAMGSQLETP